MRKIIMWLCLISLGCMTILIDGCTNQGIAEEAFLKKA